MRSLLPVALALGACCRAAIPNRIDEESNAAVVMPSRMCDAKGPARSNDPAGKQMICVLEEVLGTRVPQCVCRGESQADSTRAAAQQSIRERESHGEPAKGN
jgi:hypothetical protein